MRDAIEEQPTGASRLGVMSPEEQTMLAKANYIAKHLPKPVSKFHAALFKAAMSNEPRLHRRFFYRWVLKMAEIKEPGYGRTEALLEVFNKSVKLLESLVGIANNKMMPRTIFPNLVFGMLCFAFRNRTETGFSEEYLAEPLRRILNLCGPPFNVTATDPKVGKGIPRLVREWCQRHPEERQDLLAVVPEEDLRRLKTQAPFTVREMVIQGLL